MGETTPNKSNRFVFDLKGVIEGRTDLHVWRSTVLGNDLIRIVPVQPGSELDASAQDGLELFANLQPFYDGLMTPQEATERLRMHLDAERAIDDGTY